MVSSIKRIAPSAALVAALVILTAPTVWANGPSDPTDPPRVWIQPPVGVSAQVWIQPPVGVTAQVRLQPPVGVTPQKRIQPPVGLDQSYFEQLMLWLRAQISLPIE